MLFEFTRTRPHFVQAGAFAAQLRPKYSHAYVRQAAKSVPWFQLLNELTHEENFP